jgi:branched-subunit amino acid aminotransferase/4-amino-4-deoxychorismate lyase
VTADAAAPPDAADPAPGPLAWDGTRVVPAAEATVPLTDEGFLRGDAIFEGILVRRGRTHGLEPHLERLARSAAALDLDLPEVRAPIAELLAAYGARDGALRLIVTRAGNVRAIVGPTAWPDTMSLAVVEMPWRSAVSGVKTLSYAANQWAVRQARQAGADDAIIVDGDVVQELPTGALILVRDGTLTTPDAETLPILRSVTVAALREITEVAGTQPTVADLASADELFVVSATRPGLPVYALVLPDGTRVSYPAPGPVTQDVRARFGAHLDATLDPPPEA